ncbi:MAG TPA: MBL fold metallo-hydrolase [bacterium]|nr:MBL fold metallo-hydrolase [bacterium]HNS34397.1 MBL fold metallo-hydrolase [bacterium]HPW39353.1 MBL fold metallo-hydrolase [bacterium]
MQIQWFGQSFFKLQAKNNGEEVIIAIDPYDDSYGLRVPKFSADIVAVSHNHPDHNNLDAIKGESFIINGPGEYETKNIFVYGIPSWHDDQQGRERGNNTIYRLTVEDMNIIHLGDLGHTLDDEQLEKMNGVDVLMIPVGGAVTIDAKKANDIIAEIEPRIVIPMHYQIPGLKLKLDPLETFLKISGLPTEKADKLKINKKDLPQEETKIVILNP